jgi:hypothetical protein
MRKLLLFLLLMLVVVIGVGFYLGWVGFSTANDPATGKTIVQLSIGRGK